jgi:hypothetical protein
MSQAINNWAAEDVCLSADSNNLSDLAKKLYVRTCRTDFDAPGVCVVKFGPQCTSHILRQSMVKLKTEMASLHENARNETLVYLSAARFDQQTTTKPHLDGGPDESLIMLGYEPSGVTSNFTAFDYAKCAFDLGLSPKQFLVQHNPMFQAGHQLLQAYAIELPCFSSAECVVICINNSSAPYSENGAYWQGVMHTASVPYPDESQRRVVNSTMIASAPAGSRDEITEVEINAFLTTSSVRRRGYDKQHLDEDDTERRD